MKKFTILAALLLASSAAHASNAISFRASVVSMSALGCQRNCDSLSCTSRMTAPGLSGSDFGFKSKRFDDDDNYADNSNTSAPAQNTVAAPAVAAPQPAAPVASSAPLASTTVASTAPVAPHSSPLNTVKATSAPAPVAAAPASPAPVAAAPAPAPTTPLGIWATEENKGNVRIEECGQNL